MSTRYAGLLTRQSLIEITIPTALPSITIQPPPPYTARAATYALTGSALVTYDLTAEVTDGVPGTEYTYQWTSSDPNIVIRNANTLAASVVAPAVAPDDEPLSVTFTFTATAVDNDLATASSSALYRFRALIQISAEIQDDGVLITWTRPPDEGANFEGYNLLVNDEGGADRFLLNNELNPPRLPGGAANEVGYTDLGAVPELYFYTLFTTNSGLATIESSATIRVPIPSITILPPPPITTSQPTYTLPSSVTSQSRTYALSAEVTNEMSGIEYAYRWTTGNPNMQINNANSLNASIVAPTLTLSTVQHFATFIFTVTATNRRPVMSSVVYRFHNYQTSNLRVATVAGDAILAENSVSLQDRQIRVSWTPPTFDDEKSYRLTIHDSDGNVVTGPGIPSGRDIDKFEFPVYLPLLALNGASSRVNLHTEYTYTLRISGTQDNEILSSEQSITETLIPALPISDLQATYVVADDTNPNNRIVFDWLQAPSASFLTSSRSYTFSGVNLNDDTDTATSNFLLASNPQERALESVRTGRLSHPVELTGELTKLYGQTYDWMLVSASPLPNDPAVFNTQTTFTAPPIKPQDVRIVPDPDNDQNLILRWDESSGATGGYQVASVFTTGASGNSVPGNSVRPIPLPPIIPDSP